MPHGAQSGGQALTLDFSTESGRRRASGFSGCNRFTGVYALKDGKLSFGSLAGTHITCPAGPGGVLEKPYLDGLAHVAKSGVQMNPPQTLELTLDDGQILHLRATHELTDTACVHRAPGAMRAAEVLRARAMRVAVTRVPLLYCLIDTIYRKSDIFRSRAGFGVRGSGRPPFHSTQPKPLFSLSFSVCTR